MITRKIKNLNEFDFAEGEVILIDKSSGETSFDVVYKMRKILGIKKIGHAGTLDPAATGLLIINTGRKTKEIYKFQNLDKCYTGTITLGQRTSSMDSETEIIETADFDSITNEEIEKVRDSFLGISAQIPPMYSALKHKGKPLYKYARKGIEIKREPREINISGFELKEVRLPEVKFRITCSKGTYIRVIADDFGKKLGCGGVLTELRRTAIGEYSVDDAYNLDEFKEVYAHVPAGIS